MRSLFNIFSKNSSPKRLAKLSVVALAVVAITGLLGGLTSSANAASAGISTKSPTGVKITVTRSNSLHIHVGFTPPAGYRISPASIDERIPKTVQRIGAVHCGEGPYDAVNGAWCDLTPLKANTSKVDNSRVNPSGDVILSYQIVKGSSIRTETVRFKVVKGYPSGSMSFS